MHIVRFQGGFANQLFQLCLYERLKTKYGNDNVFADISPYRKNKSHGGFRLGKYYEFNFIERVPEDCIFIKEMSYDEADTDKNKDHIYAGYWQSEEFFPEDMSFISCFFDEGRLNSSSKKLLEKIRTSESVSLHVRRGDYIDHFLHGNIANLTYINNAVDHIKKKLAAPVFFVFSDDVPWCKKNIRIENADVHFVEGNKGKPEADMLLMSECRHNIIANSSFSWWSQKLNKNADKIVISPEYWYNERMDIDKLNSESFVHVRNVPNINKACDEPRFSVLIPVYNSGPALRRCLSSVLNQTYDNIEIIAVDDASTDDSYRLLTEYAEGDARIRLVKKDRNESLLSSRITAMKMAKGEYILFLDSDDYYDRDTCLRLNEEIEKDRADIIEFSYILEPDKIKQVNPVPPGEENAEMVINGESPHTVWNKCYSAELVKKILDNCEEFYCNMTEDIYFVTLFYSFKNSYRRIPDGLYHYVKTNGMSATGELREESVKKAIDSICIKNEKLRSFAERFQYDWKDAIDKREKMDAEFMAYLCMTSSRPLTEKLKYLEMTDERFGTDYASYHENEMQKIYDIYCRFRREGKRGKLRLIGKYSRDHLKSFF